MFLLCNSVPLVKGFYYSLNMSVILITFPMENTIESLVEKCKYKIPISTYARVTGTLKLKMKSDQLPVK